MSVEYEHYIIINKNYKEFPDNKTLQGNTYITVVSKSWYWLIDKTEKCIF